MSAPVDRARSPWAVAMLDGALLLVGVLTGLWLLAVPMALALLAQVRIVARRRSTPGP